VLLEGSFYLAVVVDAFSRRVLARAMGDQLRTKLVLDAVGMVICSGCRVHRFHAMSAA
jgi:transposase InsO family protein